MKKWLPTVLVIASCIVLIGGYTLARQERTARIIVVSTDPCKWCDRQMELLARMKKNGELKGVTYKKEYDTKLWPASSFPTLYIRTDGGEAKYVGYQTARAISKALEK